MSSLTSRPSPVATRPSGHKKGFLRPWGLPLPCYPLSFPLIHSPSLPSFPSPPFPSSPFLSFPFPFPFVPSSSLPRRKAARQIQLWVYELPSGVRGGAPAANAFLAYFEPIANAAGDNDFGSYLPVIIHLKMTTSMLNNLSFAAVKIKAMCLQQFRLTVTIYATALTHC